MSSPRVAVIVVAHNGGQALAECVRALAASRYRELAVVIVDNASSDGCVPESGLGADAVLKLDANRGFAGGVNAGIAFHDRRFGRPHVYALVNQDCIVAPGWLGPLVAALSNDQTVGVVGARLYDSDGRTLQHAGATIAANGLTEHIGRGSAENDAYREACDVDYVTGALCAFTSAAWQAFGPLDEGYFPAYFEEVDFCVRCRRGGLRVVYVPQSEAVHAEASVLAAGSEEYLRAYHAGRMRFAAQHLLDRRHWLAALGSEAAWLLSRRRVSEIRPVVSAYRTLPRLLLGRRNEQTRPRA